MLLQLLVLPNALVYHPSKPLILITQLAYLFLSLIQSYRLLDQFGIQSYVFGHQISIDWSKSLGGLLLFQLG